MIGNDLNKESPIKLFLTSVSPAFLQGFAAFVGQHPHRVELRGACRYRSLSSEQVERCQPEVLLCHLRQLNAVACTRLLSVCGPETKIIVSSAHPVSAAVATRALDSGLVRGFIPDRLPFATCLAAIALIASGDLWVSRRLIHSIAIDALRERVPAPPGLNGGEALTERQREIGRLVRCGLTNKEIGRRLGISDKTVKTHVSRMLEKTQLQRRVQLAQLI